MKLALTGYRLHDKKLKDQRTVVAHNGGDERKTIGAIRDGSATGTPFKGKLTPQYARSH